MSPNTWNFWEVESVLWTEHFGSERRDKFRNAIIVPGSGFRNGYALHLFLVSGVSVQLVVDDFAGDHYIQNIQLLRSPGSVNNLSHDWFPHNLAESKGDVSFLSIYHFKFKAI